MTAEKQSGRRAARWLALGAALGALVATLAFSLANSLAPEPLGTLRVAPPDSARSEPAEVREWRYLRIGADGWSTGAVGSVADLGDRMRREGAWDDELLIPILPTVFTPQMCDKLYYDAILESDIAPGDKVLVIGPGSGADAWVASRRTRGKIHAIDINPNAIVNTLATARLGGFSVEPLVGDIRDVELPTEFRGFDYVLWNMPFAEGGATEADYRRRDHHDGDDGTVLRAFLDRLPSLLKEDGKAIVLNDVFAEQLITLPGVTTKTPDVGPGEHADPVMLFIIPRPDPKADAIR